MQIIQRLANGGKPRILFLTSGLRDPALSFPVLVNKLTS